MANGALIDSISGKLNRKKALNKLEKIENVPCEAICEVSSSRIEFRPDTDSEFPHRPYGAMGIRIKGIRALPGQEFPYGADKIVLPEWDHVETDAIYEFSNDEICTLVNRGLYQRGFQFPEIFNQIERSIPAPKTDLYVLAPENGNPALYFLDIDPEQIRFDYQDVKEPIANEFDQVEIREPIRQDSLEAEAQDNPFVLPEFADIRNYTPQSQPEEAAYTEESMIQLQEPGETAAHELTETESWQEPAYEPEPDAYHLPEPQPVQAEPAYDFFSELKAKMTEEEAMRPVSEPAADIQPKPGYANEPAAQEPDYFDALYPSSDSYSPSQPASQPAASNDEPVYPF